MYIGAAVALSGSSVNVISRVAGVGQKMLLFSRAISVPGPEVTVRSASPLACVVKPPIIGLAAARLYLHSPTVVLWRINVIARAARLQALPRTLISSCSFVNLKHQGVPLARFSPSTLLPFVVTVMLPRVPVHSFIPPVPAPPLP